MDRKTRKEDVNQAYELLTRAGIRGAAQGIGIGLGFATIGHYTWPLFRRQTLAFKGFCVSVSCIFGLVISAENALQAHEHQKRETETVLRREARLDLARQGLVPTETEIAKWKAERLARHAETTATSSSST